MMVTTKQRPRKQYIVSVDFFPTNDSKDWLFAYLYECLVRDCDYRPHRARQLLIPSEIINKISLISPLPKARSLQSHLTALRETCSVNNIVNGLVGLNNISVVLSIGVMFSETITCTVNFSTVTLTLLSLIGLPTELVCYPVSEEIEEGSV